jgi:hypothetical protein
LPEGVSWLPEAEDDLGRIKESNPPDAERIINKTADIASNLEWGRDPRTHSDWSYLKDEDLPDGYSFYRKWIGNSEFRLIVTIVDDEAKIVAVLPKDDNTYDDLGLIGDRVTDL